MSTFNLSFSGSSLAAIARLAGFPVFLALEVGPAMEEGANLFADEAKANTWAVFDNPMGQLADSIVPIIDGPFRVRVVVGVPYGWRREMGYSGMVDSLGRYYSSDPAKPYLHPAFDDNEQAVVALVHDAVERVLNRIGGV